MRADTKHSMNNWDEEKQYKLDLQHAIQSDFFELSTLLKAKLRICSEVQYNTPRLCIRWAEQQMCEKLG